MDTNLINALKEGKALFIYTKKDGTTRKAIGTLNPDAIAERNRSITVGQIADAVAKNAYFDLEKNNWRSIAKDAKLVG